MPQKHTIGDKARSFPYAPGSGFLNFALAFGDFRRWIAGRCYSASTNFRELFGSRGGADWGHEGRLRGAVRGRPRAAEVHSPAMAETA
jgi:hypothetical protein